ncbi:MAG: YbaN family protein [Odoribacter sp.]
MLRKIIFILIGTIALILGIVGIFVPGLPTTPFLLLSSWLFYKSSKRMHTYLHRSKYLGKYIRRYQAREGVSYLSKFISIACMWTMIMISAFCILEDLYVRILLLILGGIGTYCVLFIVPTAQNNND